MFSLDSVRNPSIGYIEISALAGLGLYVIIGVIATGLSAQFYHHFEVRLGKKKYNAGRGIANGLALIHLLLMNIRIEEANLMMIYAGYVGDTAVSSKEDN